VGEPVVEGAGGGVVFLGVPVHTGGVELVGVLVDGLDELGSHAGAAPGRVNVEVFEIAEAVFGPGG
jgi:hypothetical protein